MKTSVLSIAAVMTLAFVAAVFAATGTAQAHARSVYHGGTYFGSVIVEPGQVVDGDLNVIFGNATIDGTVNGDLNVVGGNPNVEPGGAVTGQINNVGGEVTRAVVPWAPNGSLQSAYAPDYRLLWRLAWDVVVLLFFLIFPVRTRMALGRLEAHPGLSVAAGLIGWVAIIPVAILLAVTIVLIPLIPLEFVALAVGVFVGKAALALLVGRRLYELLSSRTTPSPFAALILGLVLLTAAELVPVVGTLVFVLIGLVGLGAVLLTFVSGPGPFGPLSPPGPSARADISGPPMTTA
ncbi:MAG: bactofilin family protein [Vulcanimicrobiaceae bacterium]